MMRTLCFLLFVLIPGVVGAQTAPIKVVEEARAHYPTPVGADKMPMLLREIAARLNAEQSPGGPFGILVKTGGENCGGYSCDIICAGDGAAQRQFDVFFAAEAEAAPRWALVATPTVRPCEVVAPSQPPPPTDPTDPIDPPPPTDTQSLLLAILEKLGAIERELVAQGQRQTEQTAALKAAIVELQAQVKAGVKIRF